MLLNSKEALFKVVQHYFETNAKDKSNFVDKICTNLDGFRMDIKNSAYGFHPASQDLTEDKEEDYENIIKCDASMIVYADEILKISQELELKVMTGADIQSELLKILNNLKILKEIFIKRKDYITGVAQILEIKDKKYKEVL